MAEPIDNDAAIASLESVWYDVIDSVNAGRTQGLQCPECHADGLIVEEHAGRATITCPSCKREVEVVLQGA